MKNITVVTAFMLSAVGSFSVFAQDINYYYRVAAQTDLANLKGCDEDGAFEGYYKALKNGLQVTPNVDHKKIPKFMADLDKAVAMEYSLSGYKGYDEYEAKGVSPNPMQVVKESCGEGIRTALENKAEIDKLIVKAMNSKK